MEVVLHLGAFRHDKPGFAEQLLDTLARTRDRVQPTHSAAPTGLRDVHRTRSEFSGHRRFLKHRFTCFQGCLNGFLGHVDAGTDRLALFRRQAAQ